MKNYQDTFPISDFAENIFTYTERYRGMIENEILLGNYNFISSSIENFINHTEVFKIIYGDYDYYMFLINFIEPLYISQNSKLGRDLYNKISNEIKSRLNTLVSAKEESNSNYITDLFTDEINSANTVLDIIEDYEDSDFYKSEIEELEKISNNFIFK